MFNIESRNARKIVYELTEYMRSQGLSFSSINLDDSSPYAILTGKSSVGYRLNSRWNKTGIVFFCTKKDADNLTNNLGLNADDNSKDHVRPYAVFVTEALVPNVVSILKTNPLNVREDVNIYIKSGLKYEFVKILKNKSNVCLVRNREDDQYYVKKEYTVYNEDVFNKLKSANIDGIPRLIDVEKTGNTLYTIEEYIQGYSLLEMMEKNGTLDERTVRYIAIELCGILKKLHHLKPQLIHRDIKPSNIMLDKNNKVYLIDFNASKEVRVNTSEDTVLYGTQYFAAPEQLIGYKASTPATDIFSLGATISYLLTGMYHSQIIAPGRYQKVLEKCVEMSPRDRYQSVEEFEIAFMDV